MNTILIVPGILSAVWLTICLWEMRKGRGSGPLAIGVLPIALLFMTVPAVVRIAQLIGGFQQIAQTGAGGVAAVAPFCLAIPRGLRVGAIGLLATGCVAAALQARARVDAGEETTAAAADARSTLAAWVLAISSILILAVALEVAVARGVPHLVSRGAVKTLTQPELADLSREISVQSVRAMIGGVALIAVLFVFGVANLVAITRVKAPDWIWKYSWFALAGAILIAAWLIVGATADIKALERALST